jgi:colicin import membrane protein
MDMEQVSAMEQELAQMKEAHEQLKATAAEMAQYKKDWDLHLKTLRATKPTEGQEEQHKQQIEDAKANQAQAAETSKQAKQAVTDSNARMKELKKTIRQEKTVVSKAASDEEKEAKRMEREAWKAENTQNGMTRPREGTVGARLWQIFDEVSATKGSPASLEEVRQVAEPEGIAGGSISSGYAHWRKFHGLSGRVFSARVLAEREAKEQEKAAKAADREAKKAQREAEKAEKEAAKAAAAAE